MATDVDSFRPVEKTRGTTRRSTLNLLDEAALLAACREGNPDGQRQLYDQHSPQVYRLMHRMVGPQHADDLTQQVFLRVLKTISQFRGQSAFSTWLYRLASNEALQFLRRTKRRHTQVLLADPADDRPSDERRLDDRDMLEHALAQLDPDHRAVFLLREVEHQSYYEIAMALDIAEGTVASRLNRARRLLREAISPPPRATA